MPPEREKHVNQRLAAYFTRVRRMQKRKKNLAILCKYIIQRSLTNIFICH